MSELRNRHEFVLFFDVQDGNPNGDPDAGNLPRVDPETGAGLVTDVCLKRKIRNYAQITRQGQEGYDIFVREKAVLNAAIERAWDEANPENGKGGGKKDRDAREARTRDLLCRSFFDIRAFGAVLSTGTETDDAGRKSAGQVRGPVQLTFARSVEPVVPLEHSITRMAVTNERDADKERTMGRKFAIPYGLYRCHGFVSAFLARRTSFSAGDLEFLWEAILNMFEHDRSASRGLMSVRRLIVFRHANELGSAPAADLFDRVKCGRRTGTASPARAFGDYVITLDGGEITDLMTTVDVGTA